MEIHRGPMIPSAAKKDVIVINGPRISKLFLTNVPTFPIKKINLVVQM